MSKTKTGIAILVLLGIIVVLLLMTQRPGQPHAAHVKTESGNTVKASTYAAGSLPESRTLHSDAVIRFPSRPSANAVSRNVRRSGFAWILRQLGATEDLLDRLADGDLANVVIELKERAAKGDATAINTLGFIAHQKCLLGRDEETIAGNEARQLSAARLLSPDDAAWFGAILQQSDAYERRSISICSQLIDQDQVSSWVSERAAQGDGVSLWLLFLAASNVTEMQRRLTDAAAAGFPQAQYELARAILAGQSGAAGSGPNASTAMDLLRRSANALPAAEAALSRCEFSGCEGAAPEPEAALTHALEAARRGAIDAIIAIGPQLPAGQISQDELAAWTYVHALLQRNGCSVGLLNAAWVTGVSATLSAADTPARALTLANQYWQSYGSQMMGNLGCAAQ